MNHLFQYGKVDIRYLYPLDFEEFLWAINEKSLTHKIKECFENNVPIEHIFHDKLLKIYQHYLCIGGMPACVNNYVKNNLDITNFNKDIQANIIMSYIADMSKYTTGAEAIKANELYQSIPLQLGKENKKFKYSILDSSGGKRKYESSIEWLSHSGLVNIATLVETPVIPVYTYQKSSFFKVYLNDTGLLMSLGKIDFETILFNKNMLYKGMITENYIAQTLKTKGYDLFYWESSSQAEIDFIITIKGNVLPIEVKANDNTTSKSLSVYNRKYNPEYSIRISSKNFGFANQIKSVPLYAAYLI